MKEISIREMEGLSIGHATNAEGKTGVTVLYFPNGAQVGCATPRRAQHCPSAGRLAFCSDT